MTKELLEQYPDIVAEIEELEVEIHKPVADTVLRSLHEHPYTQHSVSIRGVPKLAAKKSRLELLKAHKAEIEAFVEGLPTVRDVRLVRCVIQYGAKHPWKLIIKDLGYSYTERIARYEYEKIIKKVL